MHSEVAAQELVGPPCPDDLRYIWEWFVELSSSRTSNGFGANPLGWATLEAWSRITCVQLLPYERRALLALDRAYLAIMSEKK